MLAFSDRGALICGHVAAIMVQLSSIFLNYL